MPVAGLSFGHFDHSKSQLTPALLLAPRSVSQALRERRATGAEAHCDLPLNCPSALVFTPAAEYLAAQHSPLSWSCTVSGSGNARGGEPTGRFAPLPLT